MTYHTLRTQAHRVSLFAVVLLILLALSGSHASQAAEPTQLSFPIKINFQDSSAPIYLDYRTDGGEVYQDHGNGYTYGWSQDVSNGTHNSDDPISPNEAYDTYVRMTDLWKGIDATWEIALADGWYDVRLVVGKAGNNFSYYDVEIEGERVVSGQPYPHLNSYWLETTTAIEVTDGRLTISNGPENKFNHINFIEIDQRSTPSPDQTQPVKINFQPLGSEIVDGYFADTGMNYGTRSNGYTYGWSVNNSMYAYDHDLPQSPNQLLDTHIHMQRLQVEDYWEIELPNGNYHVRLVAGDYKPDNWGYYRFDVEDVRLIHSNGWINGQVIDQEGVIEVADGRLTVKKGEGASNNRISFIEITPILPEVDPIVSVGNADFVETFSSAPTFPQVWSSANWDWTVQVGNNPTQMGAMAADYNIGCLNPDIIDTINRLDETVYSCDGRLLTAVNGESLGIGSNYGAAYLTPNRIIDPSQDFTVQFDLSTVRTNPHGDWVEIWLMPYGTHLMSPIDFATVGQGLPQEGLRFKLNLSLIHI